jgi:hypothetical protein
MAWFNDYPDLLQEEEKSLAKEGYQYQIDEAARSEGRLVIKVRYPIEDKEHDLICRYPAAYPFFAPIVFGATIPPGRHVDPYSHRLCLFENEQSVWNPHSDNLAKALKEQIPLILKSHSSPDDASDIEGNVGYQVTGQISYENNSVIFVEDWELPEGISFGEMTLKLRKDCNAETAISGYIESLQVRGEIITTPGSPLSSIFESKLKCKWVKLNSPPASMNNEDVLREAICVLPSLKNPNFQKNGIDIVGLVFSEESIYKEIIFNWIFVIRRKLPKSKTKPKNINYVSQIIRSDRYTKENMQRRIPRLSPIVDKNILVVGAGALGSNIIWQLARSGVTSLTVIDFDIVQVGNLPRWLLGFWAVGRSKVEAISLFLAQNFPGIKYRPINFHIGSAQTIFVDNEKIDAHAFLKKIVKESDLVIDSAAETNVSTYLSSLCEEVAIPYVWATATQGGWGGITGRVIPNVTEGGWMDFAYLNANGDISLPATEEGSNIQPVGCFHPTFTGTGFDLDQVSLMATRLSVATLCNGEIEGYPDFDWDVGVLSLWDEQGKKPIAPRWETSKLVKYYGNRNEKFSSSLDKLSNISENDR